MKKVTFTVKQLLILHDVRETQGFGSQKLLEVLDENEEPTGNTEIELSEEDVLDIIDSVQWHIEGNELSDEDLVTTKSILDLLEASDTGYVNQDGQLTHLPFKGGIQISSFLDWRTSSFFNLEIIFQNPKLKT